MNARDKRAAFVGGMLGAGIVLAYGVWRLKSDVEAEGEGYKAGFESFGEAEARRIAKDQAKLTLYDYGLSEANVALYRRALARLGITL
jgi:hypothetical protein